MSLAALVQLYRLCGMPAIESGKFECQAELADSVRLLEDVRAKADSGARFDELVVGKYDYAQTDEPLPSEGAVHLVARLSESSANAIYVDIEELITRNPDLSKGDMPKDYYICNIDYYSGDLNEEVPSEVFSLREICKLIKGLSDLAAYNDFKLSGGHYSLVFFEASGERSVFPVVLDTRVTDGVVRSAQGLDFSIVANLAEGKDSGDLHHLDKVGVFGASLADFLSNKADQIHGFSYLIDNWNDFIGRYKRDLSTYLSGFAFHKAKREIAQAEFDIASNYSKVVGDITGKMLGIPLSFAAVIGIEKASGVVIPVLLLIGVFFASALLAGAVRNQKYQLTSITHAKNVVMEAIEGRSESYPEELRVAVTEMQKSIDQNQKHLSSWLFWLGLFSWAPFVVGIFLVLFKSGALIISWSCG